MTNEFDLTDMEKDPVVNGMYFYCATILTPEKVKGLTEAVFRIRGCFKTKEEAYEHCKRLQKSNKYFDIFVGDMYEWNYFSSNLEHAQDRQYAEKRLQDIVDTHRDSVDKAKDFERERKSELVNNARKTGDRKSVQQERMRRKLEQNREKKKHIEEAKNKLKNNSFKMSETDKQKFKESILKNENKEVLEMKQKEEELKRKFEETKKDETKVYSQRKSIEDQENKLNDTKTKLSKIKELYEKYKNKSD